MRGNAIQVSWDVLMETVLCIAPFDMRLMLDLPELGMRSTFNCKNIYYQTIGRMSTSSNVEARQSGAVPPQFSPDSRLRFLVSIWRQSAPTVPVWPVMPSHKPFVFNYSGD